MDRHLIEQQEVLQQGQQESGPGGEADGRPFGAQIIVRTPSGDRRLDVVVTHDDHKKIGIVYLRHVLVFFAPVAVLSASDRRLRTTRC